MDTVIQNKVQIKMNNKRSDLMIIQIFLFIKSLLKHI